MSGSGAARITVVEQGEQRRRLEACRQLVEEIATGKMEGVAPILRSAIERGWRSIVSDFISNSRKGIEGDIEKICSRHYYDFISAVQDLLEIRTSVDSLSLLVGQVHQQFSSTGEELIDVLKELESKKCQSESNAAALEVVLHCKNMTEVLVKLQENMNCQNYYAAIACMDQLRTGLADPLTQPIAPQLKKKIPVISSQLITAARNDLNPWFASFKEKNKLIGSTMLRKYAGLVLRNQQIARGGGDAATATFLNDRKHTYIDIREPSSISVYAIQSKGKSFSTEKWVPLGSMNSQAVPRDFFEPPLEEGIAVVDNLTGSLAPLHRALHICSQMYGLESLTEFYKDNREPVIRQHLFNANTDELIQRNGFENILPDILAKICGFFTLEMIVRQQCCDYPGGYFSSADLKGLWKQACADIGGLCRKHVPQMRDPSSILQVKEELLLITETLNDGALGFSSGFSASMLDITIDLWPYFERTQMEYVKRELVAALNKTAYQPMFVESEEVFRTKVRIFGLEDIHLNTIGQSDMNAGGMGSVTANLDALEESERLVMRESVDAENKMSREKSSWDDESDISDYEDGGNRGEFIPHTLPFSAAIPATMTEVHLFIARFFVFAAYCPQLSRMGPHLCRCLKDVILMICDALVVELTRDGPETPLSKACQISIDSSALSHAVLHLEGVLSETMSLSQWSDAAESTLETALEEGRQKLQMVASRSHDFIFELLCAKVEDLMASLCFVNWEPYALPVQSHDEIKQIIDFLRVTFMWLTHLPQSVREAAHFTCCLRISNYLMDYILSPKVSHLNAISIAALDMDVTALESFADSCGIAQLKQCFGELKELVKALLHPLLVDFADKQLEQRKSLFPRLNPTKLAIIVEKVNTVPASLNLGHLPRYDKKALLSLAKKLHKQ